MLRGGGTEQEDRAVAGLRTHLQAADLFGAGLRQPGHERAAATGFDELFGAPQALGRRIGLDPHEVLLVDAGVVQAGHVRRLRRAHDDHAAAGADDAAEGRADDAPLEHGGLRAQQLGYGLAGPAAARQFGIELREATRRDRAALRAEVGTTPEGLFDLRRQLAWLGAPGARSRWVSEALGRQPIVVAGP